jgi:hypothetical protein
MGSQKRDFFRHERLSSRSLFNAPFDLGPADPDSGDAAGIQQAGGNGQVTAARQFPPVPSVRPTWAHGCLRMTRPGFGVAKSILDAQLIKFISASMRATRRLATSGPTRSDPNKIGQLRGPLDRQRYFRARFWLMKGGHPKKMMILFGCHR